MLSEVYVGHFVVTTSGQTRVIDVPTSGLRPFLGIFTGIND